MQSKLDIDKIQLSDDQILYLNILHFTMSLSVIVFLLVISLLFLGISSKSPFATHPVLTVFTLINVVLNLGGLYLFHYLPRKMARSFVANGQAQGDFYNNFSGVIVSLIILRNISLVFPSIMACVAMFFIVSAGSEFFPSFYMINILFPFLNLFFLVKHRPSRNYIFNTMLKWF